jgi:predicted nucleic acid-binding protein
VIFVDTGAWYADFVSDDPDHKAARSFLKGNRERLVTTDHVIGETITLLRMRGRRARALHALKRLLSERPARIEWVREADIREAFQAIQLKLPVHRQTSLPASAAHPAAT